MNGMHRCALVLLLVFASCGSVWRGKALDMYQQYLADNPDLSAERKLLLRNDEMPTTLKDYLLLYHLRYGRPSPQPWPSPPAPRQYYEEGTLTHFFDGDIHLYTSLPPRTISRLSLSRGRRICTWACVRWGPCSA